MAVRDGAREGTLRKTSDEVRDVVLRWEQLMRFAARTLGADIGVDVQHVVPRSQGDLKARAAHLIDGLVGAGTLDGTLRIPGAAGTVTLAADLRARQISATSEIAAPQDRGNKARATWLIRQLGPDTPPGTIIEAWPRHARQPLTASLAEAREDAGALVDPEKRETLRFRLVLRSEMGPNRKDGGRSPGFIQSVTSLLRVMYRDVVQQVTPWVPAAPQSRSTAGSIELKQEPIEDEEDLAEAITAAREDVTGRTGDRFTPSADDRGRATPTRPAEDGSEAADGPATTPLVEDEEYVAAPSEGFQDDPGGHGGLTANEAIQSEPGRSDQLPT